NIEPGTATVTITAAGSGYKGTATKEFEITEEQITEQVDLKDCVITLDPESCIYNGKPQCPKVTVEYEGKAVPETKYSVEYSNNIEPGTATVTITAAGSGYKGTATKEFEITKGQESGKIDLKDCSVTLQPKSFVYNGKPQQPSVAVKYKGKTVPKTEYKVSYKNNTNAGNAAKVILTANNKNYAGSKTAQFSIGRKPLAVSMVKMERNFKWESGRPIRPSVSVKNGQITLREGTDYIAAYPKTSADIGDYTVTITGKGNYTSVVNMKFCVFAPLGETCTAGSMKYKFTSASTVMLTGTGNKKISSLKVKNTVKIGGKTFQITAIGTNAFKGSKRLKKVTLGANLEIIGKGAFYNCRKLSSIQLKGKKVKTIGKKAIKGIKKKAVIKIPKSKKKAYKKLFKRSTGYKKSMKIKAVK
ncbi:MAG: leucine-rich repeat protein, partial [Eubacterium sp.]|nr:leucine-rich repeat protein [Eubacterium sp.]